MRDGRFGLLGCFVAVVVMVGCESHDPAAPSPSHGATVGVLEERGWLSQKEFDPPGSDGYNRPPQPIEVPGAVQVGAEFVARVTTIGDGCTEPAGAEVKLGDTVAEVTAYDVRTGEICTLIARFLSRDVTLRFDTPGEATVRLIGRRMDNGEEQQEPVIIERTVVVEQAS